MTFANLGLAVDSSSVAAASPALEKMVAAAGHAEAAAARLGRSSAGATVLMEKMLAVMVSMERDLTVLTNRALDADRAFEGLGAGVGRGFGGANNAMMMSRNLMFQMVDIGQALPLLLSGNIYGLQNLGFQIAQIGQLYWGQGGMGAALRDMSSMLRGAVLRIWPLALAAGALAVGVASLTTEINRNSEVHVSWTDVVVASWQLASERIMSFFQPVVDLLGGWWDAASPQIASGINSLIGSFDLAFRDVQTIWSMLPAALGDVTISAFNGVTMAAEAFINEHRVKIAQFAMQASLAMGPFGAEMRAGAAQLAMSGVSFAKLDNPFAGAESGYAKQLAQNRIDVAGTDYIGTIGARARQIAAAAGLDDDKKNEKAAKGVRSIADEFEKLQDKVYGVREIATGLFGDMGSTLANAFRKGGNVAMNVLDAILEKVGNVGEQMMNSGFNQLLNIGLNALTGALTGSGMGFSYGPNVFSDPWAGLRLPGLATGGTVTRPGLSWVGENGPELLRLPRGAEVIPNRQSMAMAANQNGGGGISIGNITIHANSEKEGAAAARGFAAELNRHFPAAMERYQRNPLRRAGG